MTDGVFGLNLSSRQVLVIIVAFMASRFSQRGRLERVVSCSAHQEQPVKNTARARQIFFGYVQTQCVQAALDLGVPDVLASGSQTIEALAARLDAHPDPLSRLMDVLVHLGLFEWTEDGAIAHNAHSQCLRSDHENSMADLFDHCGRESYGSFAHLSAAVRDNRSVFTDAWGMSFWNYLKANPDRQARFGRAMERQSEHLLRALTEQFDFAGLGAGVVHIADIGGSKGQFFRPLARAGVPFRGTIFDLPELESLAARFVADEGLESCRFVAGDFFDSVPAGADLYVLKFVLHDWDDERAIAILKTVRAAMGPGARLMVIELLRDGSESIWSLLSDMRMLVTFGAGERTESGFRRLLASAGLIVQSVERIAGDHHLLLARRDDDEPSGASGS